MTAWCFHSDDLDRSLANWTQQHFDSGRPPEQLQEAEKIIRGFLYSEPMKKSRFGDKNNGQ